MSGSSGNHRRPALTGKRNDWILVTYQGREMRLSEAARTAGIGYLTMYERWRRGIRDERLFEPSRRYAKAPA